jgi:hypothetical protein
MTRTGNKQSMKARERWMRAERGAGVPSCSPAERIKECTPASRTPAPADMEAQARINSIGEKGFRKYYQPCMQSLLHRMYAESLRNTQPACLESGWAPLDALHNRDRTRDTPRSGRWPVASTMRHNASFQSSQLHGRPALPSGCLLEIGGRRAYLDYCYCSLGA